MNGWKEYALITAIYAVLAILFTYPLILHMPSAIAGQGLDNFYFLWNMWWMKTAALKLYVNPFYSNYVFYPNGIELLTANFLTLYNILSIPLQYIFNIVTINNIFVLFTFILSGLGTYILVHYLTGSRSAGIIAGIVFSFCPYKASKLMGSSIDLIHTEFIPFYVYFFIKTLKEKYAFKNAAWAGAFLTATALCHYYYMIFLAVFSVLYLIIGFSLKTLSKRDMHLKKLFTIAAIAAVLCSPVAYFIIKDMKARAFETPDSAMYNFPATRLEQFIIPSQVSTIFGSAANRLDSVLTERIVFPGYLTIILSLVAILSLYKSNSNVRVWLYVGAVFAVFSIGSKMHIPFTSSELPLPSYIFFERFPILNAVRVPTRFSIMTQLCLAVLTGYAISMIIAKLKGQYVRGSIVIFAGLGIMLEYLSIPVPMYSMWVPPVYSELAHEQGDYAIIELPMGWMNSNSEVGVHYRDLFYYQTIHGKRLLIGGGARSRQDKILYYVDMPVIKTLLDLQSGKEISAEAVKEDKLMAPVIFEAFKIKYVIIHQQVRTPKLVEYLKTLNIFDNPYEKEGILVFRVDDELLRKHVPLDFASMWFGYGWIRVARNGIVNMHWSSKKTSEFLLYVSDPKDFILQFEMNPFPLGSTRQTVNIAMNGNKISEFALSPQDMSYNLPIFRNNIKRGLNKVNMSFGEITDTPSGDKNAKRDWQLAVSVNSIKIINGYLKTYTQ